MADVIESLGTPKALVIGDLIACAERFLGSRYNAFVTFLHQVMFFCNIGIAWLRQVGCSKLRSSVCKGVESRIALVIILLIVGSVLPAAHSR